jgi:hypothetical protein
VVHFEKGHNTVVDFGKASKWLVDQGRESLNGFDPDLEVTRQLAVHVLGDGEELCIDRCVG